MSGRRRVVPVEATISYTEDRLCRIAVEAPDGGSVTRVVPTLAETAEAARSAALEILPTGTEVELHLHVQPPPWLQPGQVVRILSPDEEPPEPAWVGGFVDGGVYVTGIRSAGGIYPPERLDPTPALTSAEEAEIRTSRLRAVRASAAHSRPSASGPIESWSEASLRERGSGELLSDQQEVEARQDDHDQADGDEGGGPVDI